MRSDPRTASRWATGIMTVFALFILSAVLLALSGCTQYNPALYPSYDVLNPGPAVRLNPLSVNPDGTFVVNAQFLQWVDELKAEIVKLRKGK